MTGTYTLYMYFKSYNNNNNNDDDDDDDDDDDHSHSLSINVMFHLWAGVTAHGFIHHSSTHPCRQPVQVQDLII